MQEDRQSARDYLAQEREKQRAIALVFCCLGFAFAATTMSLGSLAKVPAEIMGITTSALFFAMSIATFYVFTKTNYYLTLAWVEIPFLLLIYVCDTVVVRSFTPLAPIVHSYMPDIAGMHFGILAMTFAIVCIGDWRSYLVLLLSMAALCLHLLHDMDGFGQPFMTHSAPVIIGCMLGLYTNVALNSGRRKTFEYNLQLKEERLKVESLLHNVLPEKVVQRLQAGETIADGFSEVAIVFIDIVGFSEISQHVSPKHLLDVLNQFFLVIDESADEFRVEKVKTVGDAYIAVVGALVPHRNPANDAIDFAKAIAERVGKLSFGRDSPVSVRIGIHTGAVIGGVIGEQRKSYDFWGHSMNMASRIQTAADPGTISVSESTYRRADNAHNFLGPDLVILKGVGEEKVYKLVF